MVVVTDAVFVKSRGPCGLNAPDETLFGEDGEGVLDCLPRNGADLGANVLGDGIGRGMGPARDRPQDRESLGRDGDAVVAKKGGGIGHGSRIDQVLDSVKIKLQSK